MINDKNWHKMLKELSDEQCSHICKSLGGMNGEIDLKYIKKEKRKKRGKKRKDDSK